MNKSYYPSIIFNLVCLGLLFAPYIGEYRWAGLVGFMVIGLPWYILTIKDNFETNNSQRNSHKRKYSPTLFIVGVISAIFGVAIDLILLYEFATSPTPSDLFKSVAGLFFGIPFFGFGTYLIYLSLGISKKDF